MSWVMTQKPTSYEGRCHICGTVLTKENISEREETTHVRRETKPAGIDPADVWARGVRSTFLMLMVVCPSCGGRRDIGCIMKPQEQLVVGEWAREYDGMS